jgi:leucyl-tRNA synthetase
MQENYVHNNIEKKAQSKWRDSKIFEVNESSPKPKMYCMSMLPYPSGKLHMGHVRNYTITDVLARFYKMNGYNVVHPIGWDAFGLPAENAAMKSKVAPAEWTYQNIANMKAQLENMGLSIDWARELATCSPDYYRHQQWFFIQLYKSGIIYRKNGTVNWDPVDQTVLANEQVIDGRGWRSGATVIKKEIPMYYFAITKYAEQLLADLDQLGGWPDQVKVMQRNWIGKSRGMEVEFAGCDGFDGLTVFTTRPDTLMGVTYVAISAEHPLAEEAANHNAALAKFMYECKAGGVSEAELATAEKVGMFSGLYVTNPLNGEKVPVWVANYVLMNYGTGAVMAVPAHDSRDYDFAKAHNLEIKPISFHFWLQKINDNELGITNLNRSFKFNSEQLEKLSRDVKKILDDNGPSSVPGILFNSGEFSGQWSEDVFDEIVKKAKGVKKTQYKLRDWVFSRQRYWGEPIPLIHCDDCGIVPVPEDQLPLELPQVEKYEPTGTGESPLASMTEWVNTTCPTCGKAAKRETNTMPQWAGSCWYYLRFCDPKNEKEFVSAAAMKAWLPVDMYVGGAEHAVLHLLYARFWHKVLFDAGHIPAEVGDEPFRRLKNQGLILGPDGEKMSKSRGNVINPDEIIAEFGADTLRMYEMFMGPFEDAKPWNTNGLIGVRRFIEKVVRAADRLESKEAHIRWHKYVQSITLGIQEFRLNTCVSDLMKWMNEFGNDPISQDEFSVFLRVLAPFAPHVAEELWSKMGNTTLLAKEVWPVFDPAKVVSESATIAVQVMGKLRATLTMPTGSTQKTVEDAAKAESNVQKFLTNEPKKVIYVQDKLINFVV